MQPPTDADVVVVGGGILGLACAWELSRRRPGASIAVLEREDALAVHQTGRNSGVVHAGVYYAPGSLKARLCTDGKRRLEAFCAERDVELRTPGKLVVAAVADDVPRLRELERRAGAAGVPGLRWLAAGEIADVEPEAVGLAALHSPTTGIVDYAAVCRALADDLRAAGHAVVTGCEVVGVREVTGGLELDVVPRGDAARAGAGAGAGAGGGAGAGAGGAPGDRGGGRGSRRYARSTSTTPSRDAHTIVRTSHAIACAGGWSDRLAEAAGASPDPRIVPFRGAYLDVAPAGRELVRGMVYPVPDPALPFLGVHLTRHVDGGLSIGPTALLVGALDAHGALSVRPRDLARTLAWPGTARLAWRYRRAAATELRHAVSRRALVRAAARYVPAVEHAGTVPGGSGVRAQAVTRDGRLVDDFVFATTPRMLHVRNAPSPAATAALAIAAEVADRFASEAGE